MKVDERDTPEIQSTMTGQGIRMEIDREAMVHVMSVLTNLYKDPELAIIREYSTNARDAHIEAGVDRPIEVTLPTPLAPFFKVRDYGYGLDPDDIATIYSQYGASTKRNTNEQVGSLGFGCKSALAYTDQFTLISVKAGQRCTVLVSLDAEGVGEMFVVAQDIPTDDPDGTEITISAKYGNALERKARRFFSFWEPGTVLVDGREPAVYTPEQSVEITDAITLCHDPYDIGHYLIMGNVAYPLDIEDLELAHGWKLMVRVPIGAVSIAPSRELLRYTDKTNEVVEQIQTTFEAELPKAIERKLDAAETSSKAINLMQDWKKIIPAGFTVNYKGREIPRDIQAPKGHPFIISAGDKTAFSKIGASSRAEMIDIGMVPRALWVHGFNRGFTPTCKKKLWAYCDQKGLGRPNIFVMSPKRIRSSWIDKGRHIDWKVVEQIRLPRAGRQVGPNGHIPGSYEIWTPRHELERVLDTEINRNAPVFYTTGTDGPTYMGKRLAKFLDDFTVVSFTINRLAKFMRIFPDATAAHHVVSEYGRILYESLSDVERIVAFMSHYDRRRLTFFHPTRIADPEFRRAVRLAHLQLDPEVSARLHLMTVPSYRNRSDMWDAIQERYPLLDSYSLSESHREHYYTYINAVYAAKEK